MRQFSAIRPGKQHGFVLVLTLWVMVIVAIAAGYFAERVARSVELAQQSRQNTGAIIDMSGTRAEILYRLGTTSMTEYGLSRGNTTISLDNRPYHGLGATVARLQDDRGLFNLNLIDDARLQGFLGVLGIPAERRGHLIDTLHDYTDADKLHRLNGAEEEEYLAQGLPPPANRNLISPWEAKRIIGWHDFPQLWQNGRLVELTTTSLSAGINPNTAPAEVLATLPGVTEKIAKIIIARRKLSPITTDAQIIEITGMPLNQPFGMGVIATPSDSIRITQSSPGLSWAIQYNVTLTPNSQDAPWRTDYYNRVNTSQPNEEQILKFPPRSNAPPDNAPSFLTGVRAQ